MHADDSALCSLHEPARVHRFAAWGLIEISIFFLGSSMIDVMHTPAAAGTCRPDRVTQGRQSRLYTISIYLHFYISIGSIFLRVELLHVLGCISRSKPINVKACCKKNVNALLVVEMCRFFAEKTPHVTAGSYFKRVNMQNI